MYIWSFLPTQGHVQFDLNGTRVQDRITLHQYRMVSMEDSSTTDDSVLKEVQFGYTESDTHFNLTYRTGENDSSVFPGMCYLSLWPTSLGTSTTNCQLSAIEHVPHNAKQLSE